MNAHVFVVALAAKMNEPDELPAELMLEHGIELGIRLAAEHPHAAAILYETIRDQAAEAGPQVEATSRNLTGLLAASALAGATEAAS